MPNVCSGQNLAEHFADFLVDKIMKIWKEFDQYALFEPRCRNLLTTFNMFYCVTDDMVKKLIRNMQST